MDCKDFEALLADAVGGELADADRPMFENHLASCAQCRRQYESLIGTVNVMQTLPTPMDVTVTRRGAQLIITEARTPTSNRRAWFSRGLLRYAASVLLAFIAGYALHAGVGSTPGGPQPETQARIHEVSSSPKTRGTVRTALVDAYRRNPQASTLAHCMAALSRAD